MLIKTGLNKVVLYTLFTVVYNIVARQTESPTHNFSKAINQYTSRILNNIVDPESGVTMLNNIVDNYEQCGQQNIA